MKEKMTIFFNKLRNNLKRPSSWIISIAFIWVGLSFTFGDSTMIQRFSALGSLIGGLAGIFSLLISIVHSMNINDQNKKELTMYYDKDVYPTIYKINKRYYIATHIKNIKEIIKENDIDFKMIKSSANFQAGMDHAKNKDDLITQLYAISIPDFHKIEYWSKSFLDYSFNNKYSNDIYFECTLPIFNTISKFYAGIVAISPNISNTIYCIKLYNKIKLENDKIKNEMKTKV